MKKGVFILTSLLLVLLCNCSSADLYNACLPTQKDNTFMWWAYGWPDRVRDAEPVVCFQTGYYGMALHVDTVKLLNFGVLDRVDCPEQIVQENNDRIFALPEAALNLQVQVGSAVYTCTGSRGVDEAVYTGQLKARYRIINSGRFMQRADIMGLEFKDAAGNLLEATGRLEIIAWPDTVSFLLEITPHADLNDAAISLSLVQDGKTLSAVEDTQKRQAMQQGQNYVSSIAWNAKPAKDALDSIALSVKDIELNQSLAVDYDAARNWHRIPLPEKRWNHAKNPRKVERLQMVCANSDDKPRTFRLFLESEYLGQMTGLIPVVRDKEGNPTGIYVQVSKNWHKTLQDGSLIKPILYQGDWFHGFILVHVPAKTTLEFETAIVCGTWGELPAASHAQLCLIGWGINQLWDQVAIGNWGESICYDPDVNLTRSMIDDIRPLMVWAYRPEPQTKWDWTNNIGGGDFLVYYDANNKRQALTRMKTYYNYLGPNLTHVTYAGITRDGHISANITVMTPRCDDIARHFHKVRYDVHKPTPFKRLAFYQLGADNYNDHQFERMARGSSEGLIEEWQVEKGGRQYHRTFIPCQGDSPWFSLHEASNRNQHGATANRALIIRQWDARLGGKPAPYPYAAVYGTENRYPSANVELSAWPEVTELQPGDFVEFTVELAVIPQFASDYYGPNEFLKSELAAGENTYKPALAMAKHNSIQVEMIAGKRLSLWPLTIAVDSNQKAEFKVVNGISYLPVEFKGLSERTGYQLEKMVNGKFIAIDQSVLGNDFWQTEYDSKTQTYNMIFNVQFKDAVDSDRPTVWRFSKP